MKQIIWVSSRLFGISLRGFIFECDLHTLTLKNIRDTYGGAAWSMTNTSRTHCIAVGCDDGAVRIFTTENDSLEYQRTLPTTGSRILSLAYHPSKSQLFMGCADGTIRCVNDTTGRSIYRMTGNISQGVTVHILCLHVLSDSTVVSGDSLGNVQFWDGTVGVLTTTIHQHAAQILALAVDPSEDFIFASGVDSRVTCLRRAKGDSDAADMQWVYTTSHRSHSHDVFSLAVCQQIGQETVPFPRNSNCPLSARHGPILLSGGLDTKLCVYSVVEFSKYRPSSILPIPAKGVLSSSADASIMAFQHYHHIDIWRVKYVSASQLEGYVDKKKRNTVNPKIHEDTNDTDKEDTLEQRCVVLGTIQLKDVNNIICSALSPCGTLLMASTVTGSRMWHIQLNSRSGSNSESLVISKMELPSQLNTHCHAIRFSNDGGSLAAALGDGTIWLADISYTEKKPRVILRDSMEHKQAVVEVIGESKDGGAMAAIVNELVFNSDNQWLGIRTIGRRAFIYDIDRYSILFKKLRLRHLLRLVLHWVTSKQECAITAINFHPTLQHRFAMLLSDNLLYLMNVDARQLSDWSRDNSHLLSAPLAHVKGSISISSLRMKLLNLFRRFSRANSV